MTMPKSPGRNIWHGGATHARYTAVWPAVTIAVTAHAPRTTRGTGTTRARPTACARPGPVRQYRPGRRAADHRQPREDRPNVPVLATYFSVRRGRDPFFKFFMRTIFPRQVSEYEEKYGIRSSAGTTSPTAGTSTT